MSKATEVYKGTNGTIDIYHIVDGEVVYAAIKQTPDEAAEAAQEFAALTVQGMDPDGWVSTGANEGIDPTTIYDDEAGTMIASSDWYDGTENSMVRGTDPDDYSGLARDFIAAYMG